MKHAAAVTAPGRLSDLDTAHKFSMIPGMRPIPVANPKNPWSTTEVEYLGEPPTVGLQVFEDHTREILSTNDSPDIGFRYSVNPYRGCQHACAYCYARPTHEYLSFGSGTDFDRKIVVKPNAPELLRRGVRQAFVAGRARRLQRQHRLLPAARSFVSPDARLPRGVPRVPKSGGHHHQGAAHRARHRRARRAARARVGAASASASLFGTMQNARGHRALRGDAPAPA